MMTDTDKQPTPPFHDYETLGTHLVLDRPAQSTAICTDSGFSVIGEPEAFYYKPADDYLPQPGAALITGTTSQEARAERENEAVFAARIHLLLTVSKTCVLGHNNVCFDDEVTRNVLYRNSYDPYAWSWQHDNSRQDLLDAMHACYAPHPEGISWPENDDSLSSFHLEHLAKVNGTEHSNARDTVADAYAAIAMAKLIKTRQPHLFDYLFTHRNKRRLMVLIDVPQMKPLVHASGMFGAWRGNTDQVAPLTQYPEDRNAVIMVDPTGDVSPPLELDNDTLRERLHATEADLDDNAAAPIKLVHTNKCPVLAQANMLRSEDADRLRVNRQCCLDSLKVLREDP